MYAEVGRNTLDPENPPSRDVVQEMQSLLARQPGYRGYLALDAGPGQRVFIRLWDSAAAANAARSDLGIRAFVAQHVSPGVKQRELIGEGEVLHHDLGAPPRRSATGNGTRVIHAGLPKPSQGAPFLPGPTFASVYHAAGDAADPFAVLQI